MTRPLKYYKLASILVLAVILFASCKKNNDVLGVNIQPGVDGLNGEYSDTATIYGYTRKYDSIPSFRNRYKYLGSNHDPYFGKMDIGLNLNANLTASEIQFPSGSFLTSAQMIFALDNFDYSGDPSAILSYSVFPLDSSLNPNRIYYTSNDRLHNKTPISTGTTFTYVISNRPVLVINIDSAFAKSIFENKAALASNEAFLSRYKGFYIQCNLKNPTDEGIIFKCDLEDDLSGFYLRYREGTAPADSIKSFKLAFSGSSSSKFNTMKYDYVNYDSHKYLYSQLMGDTATGDFNLFLKGMGATRVRVYIPYLKNYADSFKVAINRAEVVFNIDPSLITATSLQHYAVPSKLALIALDSLGRELKVKDQVSSTDLGRYDGGYDSDNKRYVFNIARHVQAILNGQIKNYGFQLVVADPSSPGFRDDYISRVIFQGKNYGASRPKLNLSFVKFRKDG